MGMNTFRARTADGLWRQAHAAIVGNAACTKRQPGRFGETIELLHVGFEITDPRQRWVVSRRPANNPAFAIANALWMLAGGNDSAVMNYWFRGLPKFAGHGATYAGAYGHRLRKHFGIDQIRQACDVLSSDRMSRQVVLQYWDVHSDLPLADGKPRSEDVPCSVMSMLKVRDGRLEWSQVLRSNDLFRGLPKNLVQFTLLQEIMADWLGLEVGGYHQWCDSLHAYADSLQEFSCSGAIDEKTNTDSLVLSSDQYDWLIGEMYHRMTTLTQPSLGAGRVSEIIAIDAPAGYQNLLRVLAAESARRRGYREESLSIMNDCTNPQLVQVWTAWLERLKDGRSTKGNPQHYREQHE